MKKKRRIMQVVIFLFFVLVAMYELFPLVFLFIGSIKDQSELFTKGMSLAITPDSLRLQNYLELITYKGGMYFKWFFNSFILTVIYTVGGLVLSSLVGYGIGGYDFKGKNFVFVLVLIVMMIPLEIIVLPLYKLITNMGIIDSYAGVVLPFIVNCTAIFFFRQYVSSLPKDFQEAGRLDGCTELGLFTKIVVPLMKPAFGAMCILLSMYEWNSFMWPLIVMRSNDHFTLTVGIASLINPYTANYTIMLTGSVIAILPILILFLCNQQFFIAGLTSGGVKG